MVAKTKPSRPPSPFVVGDVIGGNAQRALTSYVERIERLREEQDGIAEDLKEVYGEAKSEGFDTPIIRKVIAIRRMDPAKRDEQLALIDTYLDALRGGAPIEDDGESE